MFPTLRLCPSRFSGRIVQYHSVQIMAFHSLCCPEEKETAVYYSISLPLFCSHLNAGAEGGDGDHASQGTQVRQSHPLNAYAWKREPRPGQRQIRERRAAAVYPQDGESPGDEADQRRLGERRARGDDKPCVRASVRSCMWFAS